MIRVATIKEIAQHINVSQSTVSIVLNGKGDQYRISPATQKRILEAAHSLDYQPNISARRLRTSGETVNPIIALFWTVDTRSQLIARYLKGVQDALNGLESNYDILIQPYVGSELDQVPSLLTGTRFNGAIIANATQEDEKFLAQANIAVPLVLYLRNSSKYCFVNVDNKQAGRDVARHFAARGHRQVGLAVPIVSSSAIQLRVDGFMEECASLGIALHKEHMINEHYSEQGGYEASLKFALMDERPTAVFFVSDQMAIGGMFGFNEQGISIPGMIEVVGHDDEAASRFSIPSLTTMHLPVEEMAYSCITLMDELISHKISPPVSKMLDSHLVVRQSCGDSSMVWNSEG